MARFSISYDINEQPVGKNRPIRANFAGGSGSENSTAGAKTYTETLIALIPAEVASIYTFIIGFIPAVATEIEAQEFSGTSGAMPPKSSHSFPEDMAPFPF